MTFFLKRKNLIPGSKFFLKELTSTDKGGKMKFSLKKKDFAPREQIFPLKVDRH